MANEKIVQIPLANVARVELVTEETTPRTYVVDTANEIFQSTPLMRGEMPPPERVSNKPS